MFNDPEEIAWETLLFLDFWRRSDVADDRHLRGWRRWECAQLALQGKQIRRAQYMSVRVRVDDKIMDFFFGLVVCLKNVPGGIIRYFSPSASTSKSLAVKVLSQV